MNDQAFALLVQQITRIEKTVDKLEVKVDRLMAFRSYAAGISAALGMVGAWFHSLVKGY
jgi:hypothetical protein